MITPNWPFGTRKRVRVESIHGSRGAVLCILNHLDEKECTILAMTDAMLDAIRPRPAEREERVIEFREGGITGGYWAILDAEIREAVIA